MALTSENHKNNVSCREGGLLQRFTSDLQKAEINVIIERRRPNTFDFPAYSRSHIYLFVIWIFTIVLFFVDRMTMTRRFCIRTFLPVRKVYVTLYRGRIDVTSKFETQVIHRCTDPTWLSPIYFQLFTKPLFMCCCCDVPFYFLAIVFKYTWNTGLFITYGI